MTGPPTFFLPDNPNLRPREEVRIEQLAALPTPDGQRVRVQIQVTPFREQPNFEIALYDSAQRRVGGTTVIAAMNFRMEFIVHLRGVAHPHGDYVLRADLYYDDPSAPQDRAETAVHIPAPDADPGSSG